jgi:hypothetical protein
MGVSVMRKEAEHWQSLFDKIFIGKTGWMKKELFPEYSA